MTKLSKFKQSVDRNYPNDSNRNPSMNSNVNNSQKVSTPILSQDSRQQPPQQQQSSNRYVPSRPFNPQQQQQYGDDNQYPLPVSPRSNLPANSQVSFNSKFFLYKTISFFFC